MSTSKTKKTPGSLGSMLTSSPVVPTANPTAQPTAVRPGPKPGLLKKQVAGQIDAELAVQMKRVAHWDRLKNNTLLEEAIRQFVNASPNRDRPIPDEEAA